MCLLMTFDDSQIHSNLRFGHIALRLLALTKYGNTHSIRKPLERIPELRL